MPPATLTCSILVFLQTDVLLLPCGGCFVWRNKDSVTEKEKWQIIKYLEAFPVLRDLACFMEQIGLRSIMPHGSLGIWGLWPLYRKQIRQKGFVPRTELASVQGVPCCLNGTHLWASMDGLSSFPAVCLCSCSNYLSSEVLVLHLGRMS